jgi:hypothetical protein
MTSGLNEVKQSSTHPGQSRYVSSRKTGLSECWIGEKFLAPTGNRNTIVWVSSPYPSLPTYDPPGSHQARRRVTSIYRPIAERERCQPERATVTLQLTVSVPKACCHEKPDWLWIIAINENGKVAWHCKTLCVTECLSRSKCQIEGEIKLMSRR